MRRTRVFAGHAGWGPGQLEAEMDEESWIVEDARQEDVFTSEPDSLWSRRPAPQGRRVRRDRDDALDPSMNYPTVTAISAGRVGAFEPPSGSEVTITRSTPSRSLGTTVSPLPSAVTENSAFVGTGACLPDCSQTW